MSIAGLRCWKVSVRCARMMLLGMFWALSSDISPEGISIATTCAGAALINLMRVAKPPVAGRSSPVPKSASTTSMSSVSAGASNCEVTSVNSTPSVSKMRFLFSAQSLLRWSPVLKRYAFTAYPRPASRRATASPSPPLLPGPANTTTGVPFAGHSIAMASAARSAARSMSWSDVMFCSRMVEASSSFIRFAANIFILERLYIILYGVGDTLWAGVCNTPLLRTATSLCASAFQLACSFLRAGAVRN